MKKTIVLCLVSGTILLFCGAVAEEIRASENVLAPPDSNSGITVENAVKQDDETRVFFMSWPNLGDPNSGKDCALNYYSVAVRPGEPATRAEPVAKNVCSGLIQKSRLLDDGSALIVASKQLERWKGGERLSEYPFKALPAVTRQGIVNDVGGPDRLGISPAGHVVAVMQSVRDRLDIVSLDPRGEVAWRVAIALEGAFPSGLSVIAAADGGALLLTTMAGLSAENTFLHVFDPNGSQHSIDLSGNGDAMQPEDMENMSPAEMQAFFSNVANANPVEIKQAAAKARSGGGYDVLYLRQGGEPAAEGLYLLRLSPSGEALAETSLGRILDDIGLDKWADFNVTGRELRLSGRVLAVQQGIPSKRERYMQNVVSRIDLDSGRVETRLVPLDRRFLEAAMNAGDAELQYLPGLPGGEPVLLTAARSHPVDVAVGTVARRSVLRINEVGEDSLAWSKAADERRKNERAAASAPSEAERMEQAQQHMQSLTDGSFFDAQIAEMEKMLDDPNLSPEQRRQLEQVIEQMRASMPQSN